MRSWWMKTRLLFNKDDVLHSAVPEGESAEEKQHAPRPYSWQNKYAAEIPLRVMETARQSYHKS